VREGIKYIKDDKKETGSKRIQKQRKVKTEYLKLKLKKLHGLSPRANYTDRVTADCRRSDFADRGCHAVSVTDP
jgi:hypothetical protein